MLKKRKELKMTVLQAIILYIIATIVSICGIIAFKMLPSSNEWGIALIRTFLLVLSIWDLILAITEFLGFIFAWITAKKELRKRIKDIMKEEYTSKEYTFQINVGIGVISIILIILVITLLII